MEVSPTNTAEMATANSDFREAHYLTEFELNPLIEKLSEDSLVLDLGCGLKGSFVAREIKRRLPKITIISLEYYLKNLQEFSGVQSNLVAGDATKLPFKSGLFDAVITSELTQDNRFFTQDPTTIIKLREEIDRVLVKGGTFVAFHELYGVDLPEFTPIFEEKGVKKLGKAGIVLKGLVFGIYKKEDQIPNGIRFLVRLFRDIEQNDLLKESIGKYLSYGALRFLTGEYQVELTAAREALSKHLSKQHLAVLDELENTNYREQLELLDAILCSPLHDSTDKLYKHLAETTCDHTLAEKLGVTIAQLRNYPGELSLKCLRDDFYNDRIRSIATQILYNEFHPINIGYILNTGVEGISDEHLRLIYERSSYKTSHSPSFVALALVKRREEFRLTATEVKKFINIVIDYGNPFDISFLVRQGYLDEAQRLLALRQIMTGKVDLYTICDLLQFYEPEELDIQVIIDMIVAQDEPFYAGEILKQYPERLDHQQTQLLSEMYRLYRNP